MTTAEIVANRTAKQAELRRLKRRETPYLQAAQDLKQLAPKIKVLEQEIETTYSEEREATE